MVNMVPYKYGEQLEIMIYCLKLQLSTMVYMVNKIQYEMEVSI